MKTDHSQTMLASQLDSDDDFNVDDINDDGLITEPNKSHSIQLAPNATLQSVHKNLDDPQTIKAKFESNMKLNAMYASKIADDRLLQVSDPKLTVLLTQILEIQKIAKSKCIEQTNPLLIEKEWQKKAQSFATVLRATNSLIFDQDVQKTMPESIEDNITPTAESLDEEEKAIATSDEIIKLNDKTTEKMNSKLAAILQVSKSLFFSTLSSLHSFIH